MTSLTTLLLGGNPGHPFGPIPEAGPRWNVRPDTEVSLSGSATDPWGRDVTYAWSQSDTSGATVSLDGANTATATLIAPALEKATLLEFTLTVVAVNPGGVRPVGTTAAGDTAQDVAGVNVRAAEPVTATFVQADYTATEGGGAATVGVRLNRIPKRSVSIPLMATHAGGATEADYSIPASVTFAFADRVKYFTVTATDDTVDDNGESLTLGFGTLPPAVTAGSPSTVEVALADNDRAVTGLAVTSDPGTDATYTLGDTIKVTATFGEAVSVTGRPQLTMRVGSAIHIALGRADRAASYQSGSTTNELVFAYVVAAGDTDPDGVSVADGSLSLNGGTLEYGGGTSAGLEHGALDVQTGHKVDAIAPTFVEAFVDGATLTLRFSETLDEDSSPAGGVFVVTVGGTTRTVNAVGVDEELVTLTLASPVVPADTVKVGYNAPTTSPIRDRAGFKAASFANKAVTNHTLPAVSIAAIDPAVYEGEDIDFRLTRTGRFAQSLRVGVRVEDGGDVLDGAAGDRYVTFGVGDTTAVLTVATLDDHAYEAHTTVTGTLFEVADYTISPTASAVSVTVSDDDVPETDVMLEAVDRVAEGAGDLEVRIIARTVADDEPHGSVTVRLRSTAGTATAGADGDFGEVNQTVRFAVSDFERVDEEGTANYVATLTHDVTIHDDADEEDDETFTLRLSKLGGIQVDLNLPGEPLVVTIVDDDMVVRPGKVTGLSVTEGDEELVLSWTAVSGATGYKVQWKSGTETFADAATDGRQHVVSGGATTTSTIAGLTNGTQYATRVIATNSAGDGDASDERTGTPRAPVTTPGKVTGLSVTEGDEELVLSWTAVSGATGYKVQWKSGTETFADAATDGRQHVVSGGAITTSTIAGLTNGTQYATRVIATNSAGDGDASDERTGTPRAPVTTPEIHTTTLAMSLVEGDSSTYQVALESAPTGPVTVTVGGWSGTDISVAPTSFAFSASNWNEWQTVAVRAEQDDEHEATHEVTLTHSTGAGTAGPTVRVTVADEDGPLPKLSLRALTDSVTEGDRSHFEITRTGALDQSLRAGIMVQDLEEGYWVDELVAVYFRPGDAKDSVSYKVKVDTLTTTERTLKAWINAMLDGYEVGDPSSAVVHVIDDTSGDAAPRIGISFKQAPQVTAKEGEQGAPVIVRLSELTADAVAIPIVARGMGGAGEGDWNVPSDVVIEAGESEGTVLVSAVDDAEEDPGESIELSFGTLPRGMVTEDPGSLVVDIEDNDQFRLGSGEARAWLARFGRAAADDAMLAVRERLAAMQRPVTGSQQVTVGGYDVSAWRQALFSGHGMANTPESSPSRGGHARRPGRRHGERILQPPLLGRFLSAHAEQWPGRFQPVECVGPWRLFGLRGPRRRPFPEWRPDHCYLGCRLRFGAGPGRGCTLAHHSRRPLDRW